MKTKLTLFVTVLAAALFGVGCASVVKNDSSKFPAADSESGDKRLESIITKRGNWIVQGDVIHQTQTDIDGRYSDLMAIVEEKLQGDFQLEVEIEITADGGLSNYCSGIIVGAKDFENFYYFYFGQSGEVAFARYSSGRWANMKSKRIEREYVEDPLPIGKKIIVGITRKQNVLTVFVDRHKKYSVDLQSVNFSGNYYGFTTGWGAAAKFRILAAKSK